MQSDDYFTVSKVVLDHHPFSEFQDDIRRN